MVQIIIPNRDALPDGFYNPNSTAPDSAEKTETLVFGDGDDSLLLKPAHEGGFEVIAYSDGNGGKFGEDIYLDLKYVPETLADRVQELTALALSRTNS